MARVRIAVASDEGATLAHTEADVFGDWAVHGRYQGDGEFAERGDWTVTYVPNGKRLAGCPTKALATALARHVRDADFDPTGPERVNLWAELRATFCEAHDVRFIHGLMGRWLVEPNRGRARG